ncbi:MAG: hypothetical protein IT236_18820 [Bacteroidia bacterium]|nr:hypothetical protein [Bacteroidia bacterium]
MQLQLKYQENNHHKVSAVFIKGNEPLHWLQEIDRLALNTEVLRCFVIPKSINTLAPCGLFLILNQKIKNNFSHRSFPYYQLSDNLYLPMHSNLFPDVSKEELKALFLYSVQVFHPHVGLVGFEDSDEISLDELVEFEEAEPSVWMEPLKPIAPLPPLFSVSVQQSTVEDLINDLKKDIGNKPIEELNQDKDQSELDKFKDSAKLGLFKGLKTGTGIIEKGLGGLAGILVGLGGIFFSGDTKGYAGTGRIGSGDANGNRNNNNTLSTNNSDSNSNSSEGLYSKFKTWLNQNIEDLEKKRESELQRLLKLFDENSDEALQYALPLDSNYFSRGEAQKGWQLGRHDTNFNLGNLGGGQNVDSWDVGNYYHDLRKKYLAKAQKEIDAGNFKKAAYVYAHLLNDFSSAANVLKQGKMYREAAAIYKEHLKNINAAAECLESGGLYNEAIELYVELNKHEKAGDLYLAMNNTNEANQHFDICIDKALLSHDYLEAARLQEDKKKEPEIAINTLLQGWSDSGQQENCLRRYFEKVEKSETRKLKDEVNFVYHQKTAKNNRQQFLNVISELVRKTGDEETKELSKELAYTIVGNQLESGNHSGLLLLHTFVPQDELITGDVQRHLSHMPISKQKVSTNKTIILNKTIRWKKLIAVRNEFIALGEKENVLNLVRFNSEGVQEYMLLDTLTTPVENYNAVTDTFFTHRIYFPEKEMPVIPSKLVEPNATHKQHFILEFPQWKPANVMAAVISGQQRITFLCGGQKAPTLHHYSHTGQLLKIVDVSSKKIEWEKIQPLKDNYDLFYRKNQFYFAVSTMLIKIDEDGEAEPVISEPVINFVDVTEHHTALRFMLHTYTGCIIYRGSEKSFDKRGDFFAQSVAVKKMKLIAEDKLLLCNESQVFIYSVRNDEPEFIAAIEIGETILDVVPANRNTFAVLNINGVVSIHNIDLL